MDTISDILKFVVNQASLSENPTTINFPEELISGLLNGQKVWQFTIALGAIVQKCGCNYTKSKDAEESFDKINNTEDEDLKQIYALELVGMCNHVVQDKVNELLAIIEKEG